MKTKTAALLSLLLIAYFGYGQPHGTGAKFDINVYNQAETADFEGLGFATEIPSSYSLKKYAPKPNDQGQTGTCVGWSSAYGAMTIMQAKKRGLTNTDKITAMAFCPYYTYNQLKDPNDLSCQIGTFMYSALTSFRNNGAKRYYLPKYECGERIAEDIVQEAKNYRIKSFKKLFDYPYDQHDWDQKIFFDMDVEKVKPVKQALANGYPVPIGIQFPASFYYVVGKDLWEPTAEELAAIPDVQLWGHAMTVVGYDDNKYGGAFEILNSWGTEWGDKGFFWIRYKDFQTFVQEAYYFELFDDPIGTSGCVMGDCENGYGHIIHNNGDEYEGEFKNGNYDGNGLYVWNDGFAYGGEWKNGKREGIGTSIPTEGQPYTEKWVNDAPISSFVSNSDDEGKGCVEGDCTNGYGTYNYDNGSYTGTFSYGLRDGFGTYTYNDGSKVSCTWKADQIDGFGKIEWPEGWYYVGEFTYDMQNGYGIEYGFGSFNAGYWILGVFTTPAEQLGFTADQKSKGKSALSMANLKPKLGTGTGCISGDCNNGKGTMNYANGESYTGWFKNGIRSGFGTYIWSEGTKYEGTWRNDKMDGIGKVYFPGGAYFIGEFRKGFQDGYGIEVMEEQLSAGIWEFGTYQPGKSSLGFAEVKGEKDLEDRDISSLIENSPGTNEMLKDIANREIQR